MKPDLAQRQLDLLRKSRSLPSRDLTLGFLSDQFKRDVAKPYQQLGDLAELWGELVPERLVACSRLVGLSRGTLHVEADHAAAHFEIDRLLRSGLQADLIRRHKGPAFRKVQIKLARRADDAPADPRRQPPASDADPTLDPSRQPSSSRERRRADSDRSD